MSFISNIHELESIKKKYRLNYLKQNEEIEKIISNISKVVVDSDIINTYFGSLVSESLASSEYDMFNYVTLDNEIHFINDNGDIIKLIYNKNKQIFIIEYQSSDKKTKAKIKAKKETVIVSTEEVLLDGTINKNKKTFKKKEDGTFYQRTYEEKVKMQSDGFETEKTMKYALTDSFQIIKDEETKISNTFGIISQEFNSTILNNSKYDIYENGTFEVKNLTGIKKIL